MLKYVCNVRSTLFVYAERSGTGKKIVLLREKEGIDMMGTGLQVRIEFINCANVLKLEADEHFIYTGVNDSTWVYSRQILSYQYC